MKKFTLIALAAAALLSLSPALAGNTTLFSSTKGDIVFPISPPTDAGATAGALDNTAIGGTTPAAVAGTTVSGSTSVTGAVVTSTGLATLGSAKIDTGTKTAAATAGAATLNKNAGVITSEALTTAAGAVYTLTLTNSAIAAADQVMASVQFGTATAGIPTIANVTPAAGSAVIKVHNADAAAAFDDTIKIAFVVFKN